MRRERDPITENLIHDAAAVCYGHLCIGDVVASSQFIAAGDELFQVRVMRHTPPICEFEQDLTRLINCHSEENKSNTPDYILAKFMYSCLKEFNHAVSLRDKWHGLPTTPATEKL